MKTTAIPYLVLTLIITACLDINAKTYTHKDLRPAASDHTWSGYDYKFNIDEAGFLTGINTFSKVYNSTPTRWHNTGYYGENIRMYTGYETLTITVLPGDFNYKYTLVTAITEWQWDTHLLKWVKRRDIPSNGTRTFTTKDGVVDGAFEIPVAASLFGVDFIKGRSVNGVIPSGGKISQVIYDYMYDSPKVKPTIYSEGDSVRLNIETYMTDVLKHEVSGQYGSDENGTWAQLRFPLIGDNHDMLSTIGSLARVSLSMYDQVTLPDVYYDKYVNPYDPVTKTLPNGHTLVSTLQPDGSTNTVETWEENGYNYTQKTIGGNKKPIIGKKTVDNKVYIHYIDKHNSVDERGFYQDNVYYMTNFITTDRNHKNNISIDWEHLKTDGHYIIDDVDYSKKYYCLESEKTDMTTFDHIVKSALTGVEYGKYVYKSVERNGLTFILASNKKLMTPQAINFIRNDWNSPALLQLFKDNDKDIPAHYKPRNIYGVWLDDNGNVKSFSSEDRKMKGRQLYDYIEYDNKWIEFRKANPTLLSDIANLISMELDIPDYDTTKPDAKIVGKRTAKLLKQLCSMLKEKNHKAEMKLDSKGVPYQDIWPNNAKKSFTDGNRWINYKQVSVGRVAKTGNKVTVVIDLINNDGKERSVTMSLENNIPTDKYVSVWRSVASNTK